MQQEGKPRFLKFHQGSVRGVAFSPRDRYLFCSGGCDGKVNLYSALRMELLMCYQITPITHVKNVNAVRFTSDGSRVLAATNTRKLVVVDVERGEQLLSYDNCAYGGRDRTGLATDPSGPNLAVSVAANGKGLTLVDLRMPLPLDFVYDLHGSVIRDICFLPASWPWQNSILTGGSDGTLKISSPDGRALYAFETGHSVNSVCITPEPYCRTAEDGFYSLIMSGGDVVSAYVPETGIQEVLKEHKDSPVWKLRYTSNGSTLYTVCDGGVLRRYRRYPDRHEYLGEVYHHKGDIQDLDISPYDEYIVTASKDRTVGVLLLGPPNHGFTEYTELT
ncbi:guanine nucleotide-binding protein subunit beta-like protein A [Trichogramma pretiosum]|uniref:WD repeat-containing protein 55 homolog n=1 Tax=Trichogramma kaykai TaxID=54128 RepID=A0ABD2WDF6_9HYME|nr:guanine nucleotide-binding protein subunit beta-like protein A [Trichogramma pretiosum]XP_014221449.1 guanine nucleotide-binding protein subunit beta-like protein A [Trichogramma pretiosum]XP_014221450.1 guanine nucleotide-binding protein subunit beta-like protein A [Trichogramma pretiosum]XP_014221451.1 guanine nucleotide-binding protein subunit beta-like protein A [Trichogramma pretiosum]XP_014221452.1 guanine nucleotide-binding protein subunit beta-like protein A [Trichogramma pretiosum]